MSKDTKAKAEEIMESKVLWYPDSKKNTQMDRFRAQVIRDYGLNLVNYNDLYQWSVENYADFWAEVWRFCGIISSEMYEEVVDVSKKISDVPEWFRGSRLNYAENLLKHTDQEKVALYAAAEGREEIIKVTFGELRREVARFAASMRKMGIKAGDRVVGYLPNGVHAVEAMLAAASIGAIWSSTSVDFGVNGVLDRFSQIQPKLIFSVAAVVYNGKQHDHMDKLQRVVKGLPDLKKVVVIPYVRSKGETDLSKVPNSVFLEEFLDTGMEGDQEPQLEFEQLPFSHPLFIMYSSGTTGAPKCMVHSAGVSVCVCVRVCVCVCVSERCVCVCSGGTDIISCFMGQNFTVPVYRGEIQARNLGMAVESWSPEGKAVWGESGELVCLKPIPCQPTHFWNDDNGNKYRKAYFSTFPGVWAHGDYCKINPKTGGIVMLGRSDGTLNPNGVRFGSSEIYNIVEAFEEVCDSVCVPQYNSDGEERVILFLKLVQNQTFSSELVAKIRSAIRVSLSARHVPAVILPITDIPYTISGKKVEVAVKQVIAGKEVSQRGAFSNPESLDLYKNIPELQNF
ncbi:acetoacetyl-CoA synthetase [Pangasianodon hypophthalmus]|nr:acetoacetyl-CoA synthetase [Pangasianodon hypophthalmus]